MLGVPETEPLPVEVDWIEYRDAGGSVYRGAWLVNDRLEGCVYFDRRPSLPERAWLAKLFTAPRLTDAMRASLLAGRAVVGCNPIAACARELGAAATAAEIGKRLKCGTNCGSCVPEIQTIIGDVRKRVQSSK